VPKLGLAAIVVAVVGGALWIEQGHRIVIEASPPADLASLARAAACPDNDTVPYSASCIAFLQGGSSPHWQWRINSAAGGLPTHAPK
jgi:hypothetical protein